MVVSHPLWVSEGKVLVTHFKSGCFLFFVLFLQAKAVANPSQSVTCCRGVPVGLCGSDISYSVYKIIFNYKAHSTRNAVLV